MSALQFADISEICGRGSVKDADVAALRRAFTQKPSLKPADVEALFYIQDACPVQDPVWAEFFIDTVTDYLVRELEPSGYLTHGQGTWLIARISVDGRVRTKTEFDLLVNVLDKSRWAPASLACFRACPGSGRGADGNRTAARSAPSSRAGGSRQRRSRASDRSSVPTARKARWRSRGARLRCCSRSTMRCAPPERAFPPTIQDGRSCSCGRLPER